MKRLQLEIISQEKHLLSQEVDQITAPASQGEVTILPSHIPFFTRLDDGIVVITDKGNKQEFAIMGGFMDVGPSSQVTIMADAAFEASSVNEAKALEAKKQAEIALSQKQSEIDFRQTEASLRKAILELKVARRQKTQYQPQ
jgi:F-type H+-transporting ATPase subunit epsilon